MARFCAEVNCGCVHVRVRLQTWGPRGCSLPLPHLQHHVSGSAQEWSLRAEKDRTLAQGRSWSLLMMSLFSPSSFWYRSEPSVASPGSPPASPRLSGLGHSNSTDVTAPHNNSTALQYTHFWCDMTLCLIKASIFYAAFPLAPTQRGSIRYGWRLFPLRAPGTSLSTCSAAVPSMKSRYGYVNVGLLML